MNSSVPGVFCLGRLLIMDSISLLDIVLFRLSISSCVSLNKLHLSQNRTISCRLSNSPLMSQDGCLGVAGSLSLGVGRTHPVCCSSDLLDLFGV